MSNNYNLIEILNKILAEHSYKDVANKLNLAVGTIKRWKLKSDVPKLYLFDLLRMNGENINYKDFTYKEKDQFFTPKKTAKYCFKKLLEYLGKQNEDKNSYDYIEPSAGSGNFLKILPTNKRIGIDMSLLMMK